MHVVADDCALPRDKGITGRRGVAGTVLVAKVAGAAAEAGLSLEEVNQTLHLIISPVLLRFPRGPEQKLWPFAQMEPHKKIASVV